MRGGVRGCYPTATERERERARERECVCVCERERERMRGEARRSDAVRVGPAWLQWHGCEFVTDVNLRRNGGGHMRVKTGEKERYISIDAWPRLGERKYIRDDKYATCKVAT